MDNKIKVSIVIPVYNVEKYLKQCLDSVLNQTLKELEVICVDDGSTDGSLDILEQYSKKDKRLKIIAGTHTGPGAARNKGIEIAKGEYIGFVDSDDFVDETMFEKLYKKANSINADIVICNLDLYYVDTGYRKIYRDVDFYHELEMKNGFKPEEYPKIVRSIAVWDRIYKLDFIKQFNLKNPENIIYEDALFSYQTSILANKIGVINEPLYMYRKNAGASITDREIKNDKFKFDYLEISRRIKDFLIEKDVYDIYFTNFWNYHFEGALWHQGNTRNFATFKKFFNQMREMLDDKVYAYINCQSNEINVRYVNYLKNNKLLQFYVTFGLRIKIKRTIHKIGKRFYSNGVMK